MRLKSCYDWGHTAGHHTVPGFERMKARKRFGGHPVQADSPLRIVAAVLFLFCIFGASLALAMVVVNFNTHKAQAVVPPPTVEEERKPAVEYVRVLAPIRNISKGQALEATLFTTIVRPRTAVAQNVVWDLEQIKGKFARNSLPAHLPFVMDWVTDELSNPLIEQIPLGFRAVTINVNATTGVEGWARAGAKVDVHLVADLGGEKSARRIVENARVLSAERQVEPSSNTREPLPTTVTLLTSERDAQRISLAASAGKLILHLRGFEDSGQATSNMDALTLRELLGLDDGKNTERVQGTVRIRNANGLTEELALINGELVRR